MNRLGVSTLIGILIVLAGSCSKDEKKPGDSGFNFSNNRGMNNGLKDSPTLDPALVSTMPTGLRLTEQDKMDLVAFLHTLSDYSLINDARYSNPH